jgi:hypothetical protein
MLAHQKSEVLVVHGQDRGTLQADHCGRLNRRCLLQDGIVGAAGIPRCD